MGSQPFVCVFVLNIAGLSGRHTSNPNSIHYQLVGWFGWLVFTARNADARNVAVIVVGSELGYSNFHPEQDYLYFTHRTNKSRKGMNPTNFFK